MTAKPRVYIERDPSGPRVRRGRALLASGQSAPIAPPADWFENPNLDQPTPLTVTADGRVYGHIASWDTRHIGLPGNVRPPKSASDYAYFKTGQVLTADGSMVSVGQITLSGGHAPLSADASAAVRHYDDTNSAVVDVNAGEDRHGIWVAGALRPDVPSGQVRALRASAPSGDWRPINGRLELVAVCSVNVPGFPIARAMTASGGEITALVAAGASEMYRLQMARMAGQDGLAARVEELEAVVAGLTAERDQAKAEQLRAKVHNTSKS